MTTAVATIDSNHDDMIHDCQFDYYSKKMATCSSDRSIKIFDVSGDIYHCSATLTVHDGPVWQVAWAHPRFGVILASCSYDGSVVIQKDNGGWNKIFEVKFPEVSVNSISWAPHELGLTLACATSDGKIVIIQHNNGQWSQQFIQNDSLGCNAVSWAPYHSSTSHSAEHNGALVYRLVAGSCDNIVRVWRWVDGNVDGSWREEPKSIDSPHSDWVRDVAWAPNSALPYSLFASCSEDKTVYIWRQNASGVWESSLLRAFEAPVWRLSWSVTGTVLAVSTGDHKVTLWKQAVDESWMQISSVDNEAQH